MPLLRIRSDEQLVKFFREGNEDAFTVIHDRYRHRLQLYAHRMLGSGGDPEAVVQDIFVRAHKGLRASDRELALRAWLFRIAHNLCIDELRRPHPVIIEAIDDLIPSIEDPVARAEERAAIREVVTDIHRLPDQQRSAILAVEICDMTYADVASALHTTEGAVKSLLVRARVTLTEASLARNTDCARIRNDLVQARQNGARASKLARLHMRDCSECRRFRAEMRSVNRSLAALAPTLGPLGVIAHLLGFGGSSAAGGGAVAGGGAAGSGAAAGAAGTGAAASTGLLAGGATHVVTLLAAAVVTAGSAVELHNTLATAQHHAHHRAPALVRRADKPRTRAATTGATSATHGVAQAGSSSGSATPIANQIAAFHQDNDATPPSHAAAGTTAGQQPLTMTLDPDNLQYVNTGSISPARAVNEGIGGAAVPSAPGTTTVNGMSGPSSTGTGGPTTSAGSTASGLTASGSTATGSTATGSAATGSTATGSTATGSTATDSTGTGSPTGASTSSTAPPSSGTSSTSSSTGTPATAGGAQSVNSAATNPSTGSSSTSPAAAAGSVVGPTSSSTHSKPLSGATSTNSVPLVVTKHRPRHKVLVGRLL